MSDMGLDIRGDKRRRAQVFSKVSNKAIDFMKQQKSVSTNQREIDPARR